MQVRTEVVGGRLRLFSQYSPELIRRVRAVGGKWIVGCWEFPLEAGNRVIGDLFGCSENTVRVRVKRNSDAFPLGWEEVDNCVLLGGYVLARRNSRDDAVAFVEDLMVGSVPAYGGSVKNPRVNLTEDAEFELEVRVDFAQSNGLEIISKLANGLEVSAEGAAEDSHQPAVACLESFAESLATEVQLILVNSLLERTGKQVELEFQSEELAARFTEIVSMLVAFRKTPLESAG
jgi:hypothetical protein